MLDNLGAFPAPILLTPTIDIITPFSFFNIDTTARGLLEVLLFGVLVELLLIISAVQSCILLTCFVFVDRLPTVDTVLILADWARELRFMLETKGIGAARGRAPGDTAVFVKGFIEGEIIELLIFVSGYTLFNVLIRHLFATTFLRTEDMELELVDIRLDVFLQAFPVEDVLALGQWNVL